MRSNELAELIAFAAVAEHKSFRRAAEQLGLTASTLSHSLRALETRMDVRLLNRTTRSVALTEAGMALLDQVGPALRQIAGAVDQVNAASSEPRGTVRINASHLAADLVLGRRLGDFARAHPGITLDIASDDRFVDMVGNGYDAGIRLGDSVEQDMVAIRLTAPLRIVVVGSPAYLAERPAPATPDELDAHRCIGYRIRNGSGTGKLCKWEFGRDGVTAAFEPGVQLVVDSHALLVDAALSGAGLAYVVEAAVAGHLAAGRLVTVLDDWCAPVAGFFLYYPSQRQLPSALRALVEFLRAGQGA